MNALDELTADLFPFSLAWFVALFAIRTAVVLQRGYKVELGTAKGDPRRGVLYSLTFSMLPWKKDSTRRHPWTYLAGMAMHLGVFFTFAFAVGRRLWTWPAWSVPLFGVIAGIGFLGALGLFTKRLSQSYMQSITTPDDYLSNTLVQFWLLGGCLTAFIPHAQGLWRLGAILLLFYIPLGKIYHMLLFFVSRILFGLQFGRRGVLRHDFPISY